MKNTVLIVLCALFTFFIIGGVSENNSILDRLERIELKIDVLLSYSEDCNTRMALKMLDISSDTSSTVSDIEYLTRLIEDIHFYIY